MSYRENALIIKTSCLAEGIYEMWLKTDKMAGEAVPGQFISVYSNDGARLLPRPISICRIDKDNLRIVYRVAGKGTEEFSKMKEGEYVNIQGPLGNGYDIKSIMEYVKNVTGNDCADTELKAILFGGGIGVPPMLELAKQLKCKKQAVLGYKVLFSQRQKVVLTLAIRNVTCYFTSFSYVLLRLKGYTNPGQAAPTEKLVFSFADITVYRKVKKNLDDAGVHYLEWTKDQMIELAKRLVALNKRKEWNYTLATCGEAADF